MKSVFAICSMLVMLSACGETHDHVHERESKDGHAHAHSHDGQPPHSHDRAEHLMGRTEDGLWPTDGHTAAMMHNVEQSLARQPKDLEGYRALGKVLDGQMAELIEGCTMKGQSHEVLHGWLSQFLPTVKQLYSHPESEMPRIYKQLGTLMGQYKTLFVH